MKKHLYANWKMYKTRSEAQCFLGELDCVVDKSIGIGAGFTLLSDISMHSKSLGIKIGAQTMSEHLEGAFTGEVSAKQLKDVGADFVILGHSERRYLIGETNEVISKKVESAIGQEMSFILCIGENIEQREGGYTKSVLKKQLTTALCGTIDKYPSSMIIAYEPVWAIGTNNSATPHIVNDINSYIREEVGELYNKEYAKQLPILYGGSVKLDNLESFLSQSHIDGALVGSASLIAKDFNKMIQMIERG